MPIHVTWANPEKTIVLTTFGETWTLEEFHDSVDAMHSLVTSVNHTVHIVSDFSASRTSPAKLMSTGRHVQNKKSANSGISVSVGANHFLQAMLSLAGKLFLSDIKLYPADTLDEAYELIRHYEQETAQNVR